jgi:myo-inositol 2-dehydrogenase / D-chiro-inositol 1-dehydrogenase
MKKITVGVIGAGRIGQLHANNLLRSDFYELKILADVYTDHLKETYFAQNIQNITNDVEVIFEDPDIDAVFICSSTDTHVDYIKRAARCNKHVFCEKPISLDVVLTKEALEVVHQCGVNLQVGFNRRFDKHFRSVRKLIQEEKIGKLHVVKITSRDPQIPPESYIKRSGGMFRDMTIHDFDMVRYLTGSEVAEVHVKAANLIDPVFSKYDDVDTAIITLILHNGAMAVIDNSRQAVYGYDQRIEVFGSNGAIEVDNEVETNIKVSTKNSISINHPKLFFLERYRDTYIAEINEFAHVIDNKAELSCSGEDSYQAELLAMAAYKSWKENRTVFMSEILEVYT